MPTSGMTGFIGGVSVIPASGSLLARKSEASLRYNDQVTKNKRNVSCVDLKHGNLRNTVATNLKTVCANCQRLGSTRRLGWRVGDLVADD